MDAEINQVDIKFTFKQVCFGIGLVIAIGVSILGYYIYKIYYPSTDDAYASAPLINLTAKVNGSVKKVYVNNNQFVKSGDLLLELDPQDYTPLLEQANLDILMATKTAVTANQQRDNAKSNVNKAESNYTYAQQMAVRYTNLFNNKAGSQQTMQKFVNDRNIAKEVLDQARVVFKQATIQSELAKSKIDLANVQLEHAKRVNSYTLIYAPTSGYVTDLNLQTGQVVIAGQKLFGLVDNSKWWIDANFKESQLSRLIPNQKVKITLDMYNHTYEGVIKSISHASTNTFSLLPSQNASGNWVKVTQRFTVRVALNDDPAFPLRVGASAIVSVNTTHQSIDEQVKNKNL